MYVRVVGDTMDSFARFARRFFMQFEWMRLIQRAALRASGCTHLLSDLDAWQILETSMQCMHRLG